MQMRLRQKLTLMLITLLCTLQSHGMNPEQEKINIKKGNEEKLTFQIDSFCCGK
jgi:hypothetical protein